MSESSASALKSESSSYSAPVSQLLNDATKNAEEPKKKSREDWRKAKELEEARKAGTAPAAVDEEGRDINPHIPQYISNAPWYYNSSGPTLKHQRPQDSTQPQLSGIDDWYKRGVDSSGINTKFRKGACANCGAMTHKKVDCMERPRKVGAKYSGIVVAHDEFIQPKIVLDYDGKRDRWSGFDPAAHHEIIEEYQKVEEAKQKIKAEKLKDASNQEESDNEEDDDDDEDKYADGADMPGTKVDSKQRITVRNLRIREDTAKYLRNLDPNSAYYDPKTRSMRDNPNPAKDPNESSFAGENFVRYSGDTTKHSVAQLFAWEAYGKGVDVHLLAEPTKLEMLQHEYEKKKEEFKSATKDQILENYGGDEHLKVPPKALLLAQTEEYVEYSRSGKVLKGNEKQANRSRYEEDVYVNNHTSVWGSYWHLGSWGYKCCHSTVKGSYCVGEKGKQTTSSLLTGLPSTSSYEKHELHHETPNEPDSDDEKQNQAHSDSSQSEPETTERKSKKKSKKNKKKSKKKLKTKEKTALEKALEAEEKHQLNVEKLLETDERKRSYNSMYEVKAPTEEEVEAYLMKRRREDDPMAAFMNK